MAKETIFRDKDNEKSMARVIAFLGAVGGLVALAAGIVIAILGAISSPPNKDIAGVGKDIVVAGLGVFTAGGLTKVGSGFAESLASRKERT
jgi:hypothetical protein